LLKEDLKRIKIIESVAEDCWDIAEEKGFHEGINKTFTDQPSQRTARLMLIISEVIEGWSLERDKSHIQYNVAENKKFYKGYGEELADIVIRVFDLAKTLNLPIGKIIVKKMEKNRKRETLHGHKNF